MLRFGRLAARLGALISGAGLVAGRIFLANDMDGLAKGFLAVVPIGFLLLFTGVVTALLAPPDRWPS